VTGEYTSGMSLQGVIMKGSVLGRREFQINRDEMNRS
jgi:hypothetical protein